MLLPPIMPEIVKKAFEQRSKARRMARSKIVHLLRVDYYYGWTIKTGGLLNGWTIRTGGLLGTATKLSIGSLVLSDQCKGLGERKQRLSSILKNLAN